MSLLTKTKEVAMNLARDEDLLGLVGWSAGEELKELILNL